jgi:rRNA-processing protein FCF1
LEPPVVIVLEGRFREAAPEQDDNGIRVVQADGSGDDSLVSIVEQLPEAVHRPDREEQLDEEVVAVTADRELRRRLEAAGAQVVGPGWLLERLGP